MAEERCKLLLARFLRAASLGFLLFGGVVIPVLAGGLLFGRHIDWGLASTFWLCLMLGVLLAGFSFLFHRDALSGLLTMFGLLLTFPIWTGLVHSLFQ